MLTVTTQTHLSLNRRVTQTQTSTQRYRMQSKGKFENGILVRVTSWINRFIANVRKTSKVSGELPPQELKLAEEQIIKTVQCFPEEIRVFEDKKRLLSKAELLKIRRSVMEDYFDLTRD